MSQGTRRTAEHAAKHAGKVLAARRADELLRIRLDGAEFWDVREYVREKEAEEGSAWALGVGESPMSESQIRRYQQAADRLIEKSAAQNRKRMVRMHAAKRRNLYAKAVLSADYRTALACARDEAELLGLYPGAKHTITGPRGAAVQVELKHDPDSLAADIAPYLDALRGFFAAALAGAGPDALPGQLPPQPLGGAEAPPETGRLPGP